MLATVIHLRTENRKAAPEGRLTGPGRSRTGSDILISKDISGAGLANWPVDIEPS